MRGLLFIAIAVAVIILIQSWQARRKVRARHERDGLSGSPSASKPTPAGDVIDMVACPVCGTYFDPTGVASRPYCSKACQAHAKHP